MGLRISNPDRLSILVNNGAHVPYWSCITSNFPCSWYLSDLFEITLPYLLSQWALWMTDCLQMIVLLAILCSLAEITHSDWMMHTYRSNAGREMAGDEFPLSFSARACQPLFEEMFEFTSLISHTGPCLVHRVITLLNNSCYRAKKRN